VSNPCRRRRDAGGRHLETFAMADDTPLPPMRCIHLTCKSMMVYGEDFEQDPEFQAGMVEFQCLRTLQNVGPDLGEAALEPCTNPERTCYEAY
jgi:hypothetical protein